MALLQATIQDSEGNTGSSIKETMIGNFNKVQSMKQGCLAEWKVLSIGLRGVVIYTTF
jgi:hypothetical protein